MLVNDRPGVLNVKQTSKERRKNSALMRFPTMLEILFSYLKKSAYPAIPFSVMNGFAPFSSMLSTVFGVTAHPLSLSEFLAASKAEQNAALLPEAS